MVILTILSVLICPLIESIRYSNDPCFEWDGISHQAIGVSTSIKMFVMVANHGNLIFKKVDPFHNLHANQWVLLYILILFRCQLALFLEYFIPDTDLADVMKERSKN